MVRKRNNFAWMEANKFDFLGQITADKLMPELERASTRFHVTVAWVAIILDPVFALTDYFNIPGHWQTLLIMRLVVSAVTLTTLLTRKKYTTPSFVVALVPFFLISVQNAYVYAVIDTQNLLGQNLNYMALLIGAAMFVLWRWYYSVLMIGVSAAATGFFLTQNPQVTPDYFFIHGGLLLMAVGIFTVVLINTRYRLVVREIRARLALRISNEAIRLQAEQIKSINENLEKLVQERTSELEIKNKALEEAAFINAHKLRAPVASILGLVGLIKTTDSVDELKQINVLLQDSTEKLDAVVSEITRTIEGEPGLT
ncbi:MAG: HAMP domain-containing histidine kinase [Cyclobacteriaceae bacterium]|nr:HAMP domain-containing histidine kinase [Cyclobacteriaceae bacterium]